MEEHKEAASRDVRNGQVAFVALRSWKDYKKKPEGFPYPAPYTLKNTYVRGVYKDYLPGAATIERRKVPIYFEAFDQEFDVAASWIKTWGLTPNLPAEGTVL